MFTTFIVIDRELGPIEAMKESMRIARGHRWPLLGLIVLLALIVLVGVLALFVGLLVAMPVTTLAFVHAYRVLSGAGGPSSLRLMHGSPPSRQSHLSEGAERAAYSAGTSGSSLAFRASAALRGLR